MKVSVNQIKRFLDFDLPPVDELVKRIGAQLGEVEEVIDLGAKYKDALIVRVVECEKHPDADKLSVCKIDDGGKTKDVPRDDNGLIQVVCGAPNVRPEIFAVWLPPGATVPASYDDKEPFVLSARELRGVLSQGMLAAGDELAINSDHDGIIEITKKDITPQNPHFQGPSLEKLVGHSFAEVFGLDDWVIDIENKMFTHRPDCFGQLGVSREVSAILGGVTPVEQGFVDTRFNNPDWYWKSQVFSDAEGLKIDVFNDAPEKAPRFMAVAVKNVEVKPSPLWLQCALVAMGAKPINNIVDITNYVMLITAQPTHAYDYDKLRGNKLGARMAKKGEKATLLNGKEYEFDESDIVIADGEGIVGLAGIMGGLDSEVTSETKNIVLECANFDMYSVRKSSMRQGIFTDALTRFNKGQSPLQNDRIIAELLRMITELAGGEQASKVFDMPNDRKWSTQDSLCAEIGVTTEFINSRLGCELTSDQIGNILRRANFASRPADDDSNKLLITAPFWRTDIEIPEDIVEEVGRLYGYDKLPLELPKRSIKPAKKNELIELKQQIRDNLSKAGANEVLTYSFVNSKIFDKAGQNRDLAYRLTNALSPDLEYYRLGVTPSLLDKVHSNIKAGYDEFAIFELGKGHNLIHKSDEDDGVPPEFNFLDLVYSAKKSEGDGAAFYKSKKLLDNLAESLGCSLKYVPVTEDPKVPVVDVYEISRSAYVSIAETDEFLGMIGEFKSSVRRNFKLPDHSAGFCIGPEVFLGLPKGGNYQPLSKFPKVTQDITLKTDTKVSYGELVELVEQTITDNRPDNSNFSLTPLGIYQADDDKTHKNISFRLEIASYDKTLTDQEVNKLLDAVSADAKVKLQAERV